MKKATIMDVAKLAGVSKKTVSRVLNKEPYVREVTKERVESAMNELDYHPSLSARSLANKRSYLICILYFDYGGHHVYEMQNGLSESLNEQGYSLLLQPCPEDSADIVKVIEQKVRHLDVDGFVLAPSLAEMDVVIQGIKALNKPYVRFGPGSNNSPSEVSCGDMEAAYEVTQHLLSQGIDDIAFIAGRYDRFATVLRQEGFDRAMFEAGIDVPKTRVEAGDFSFDSGVRCARKLLDCDHRPRAIFASNDLMAAGALYVAHELNIKVPEQLAVVGFDNSPLSLQVWPALSTVSQPNRKMAQIAAQKLLDQIHQRPAKEYEALSCTLVLRDSSLIR